LLSSNLYSLPSILSSSLAFLKHTANRHPFLLGIAKQTGVRSFPPPNATFKMFSQPLNCGAFACTASNVLFIAFLAAGEVPKAEGAGLISPFASLFSDILEIFILFAARCVNPFSSFINSVNHGFD
jgi:hypothetical protein